MTNDHPAVAAAPRSPILVGYSPALPGRPMPVAPAPVTAQPDAARRSALLVVFLVVFIDLLGFGIVLPLLPRYADFYLAGASGTVKGLVIGALYSSFSLMQFVFSPVWGRVSDRIGRRPILVLGLAGSVVFYALFAFASTIDREFAGLALGLMMLARVGAGIAGASVGTAAAVIADSTTPETRSRGMALIGVAFGIGFTFGPLIAYGSLRVLDSAPWAPGAAASALSLVALVIAVLRLPETLKPGAKPPREFFSPARTLAVLRQPAVGPVVLVSFLAVFAFANFESTLALLTKTAFLLGDDQNFLVFAFVGLVLLVVQGGVYRPLAARRSDVSLLTLGLGLMLAGLVGVGGVAVGSYLFRSAGGESAGWLLPMFYFSVAVAVSGFAFTNPSLAGLVSRRADPTRQGEVLGVSQSASALARILGPMLGLSLFYAHPSTVAPYIAAVAVLAVVAGLVPAVRRAGAP